MKLFSIVIIYILSFGTASSESNDYPHFIIGVENQSRWIGIKNNQNPYAYSWLKHYGRLYCSVGFDENWQFEVSSVGLVKFSNSFSDIQRIVSYRSTEKKHESKKTETVGYRNRYNVYIKNVNIYGFSAGFNYRVPIFISPNIETSWVNNIGIVSVKSFSEEHIFEENSLKQSINHRAHNGFILRVRTGAEASINNFGARVMLGYDDTSSIIIREDGYRFKLSHTLTDSITVGVGVFYKLK